MAGNRTALQQFESALDLNRVGKHAPWTPMRAHAAGLAFNRLGIVNPNMMFELAHHHLPAMMADISNESNNVRRDLRTAILLSVVSNTTRLPIFWRFVRANPQTAANYLAIFISESAVHEIPQITEGGGKAETEWNALNEELWLISSFALYDERIVPLASSHPAVRKFITVGRALVKTGMVIGREKADRYPVWILARLDVALDKFSLAPPTPRNYSRTESMARRTMAWHGCESQRPDNREDAGFGEDCEPEGAGADMMCSRCLTVRYCSTRHQKQHWQAHKPFCKASIWPEDQ